MSAAATASQMTGPSGSPISVEALLDSTIPGFSIVSNLAKTYLRVDIPSLISTLLPLVAVVAAIRYLYDPLLNYLQKYGTSSAEIRNDDEMFNYVMNWLARQKFTMNSRRFLVGTRITSDLVYDSTNSDDEDEAALRIDEEADWKLADENFDAFWAKTMARDKIKAQYFTPCEGSHYFKYQGRWLSLNRSSDSQPYNRYGEKRETLIITCLGRNNRPLRDLLKEAQQLYVERDRKKTVIYRKDGANDDWSRCMSRPPRPLSTVVLDQHQKNALVDDIREYLSPSTKRWYANRGIPYRRGFLFYGPPGTGKTSLCVSIAGIFGLDVYVTSLNSRTLTEDGLASLFGYLPERCVVLLEDVDTAGITNKRAPEVSGAVTSSDVRKLEIGPSAPADGAAPTVENAPPAGISLSGLLNVIDGVSSSEGRILIMTTNHVAKLDPALLRPGRIDMSIAFENASTETAAEMFRSTYTSREEDYPPSAVQKHLLNDGKEGIVQRMMFPRKFSFSDDEIASLATQFASQLPAGEFSPAEIQGYLLKHKSTPREAADGVVEWISKLREEKERQRTPQGLITPADTPVMV